MKIDIPAGRVGIFVSGGLDSAFLYYLMLSENKEVVPLLLFKSRAQYNHARVVVQHLQSLHQTYCEPILLAGQEIRPAISEAVRLGFNLVYLGVTKELKEFLVDWQPNNFKDTRWVRGPFKDMDKSQIVQLVIESQAEFLFSITHSCAAQPVGRCETCNRCRERSWAFSQLGLTDPGRL
jgi:7-cyano-7-deazaguanine synthase in queuosine biosynthesis